MAFWDAVPGVAIGKNCSAAILYYSLLFSSSSVILSWHLHTRPGEDGTGGFGIDLIPSKCRASIVDIDIDSLSVQHINHFITLLFCF